MLTIEYKAVYGGVLLGANRVSDDPADEIIRVKARDLNSGFQKALRLALEPLGNGKRRQVHSLEFWRVV